MNKTVGKSVKPFRGKNINELPLETRRFIAEKIRRGWIKKAIQEEVADRFRLLVPETFIFA